MDTRFDMRSARMVTLRGGPGLGAPIPEPGTDQVAAAISLPSWLVVGPFGVRVGVRGRGVVYGKGTFQFLRKGVFSEED